MDPTSVKDLIEFMVKALVDQPEAVIVTEDIGENTTAYRVKVAEGETGKIIGKSGRTAGAMRVIMNAASGKHRRRASLDVLE